jgi:hypothetical protein
MSINIVSHNKHTHCEQFYYVAVSLGPEFESSSGHDTIIWMYTEINYYNLEIPDFNIENTLRVHEKCTRVKSNIKSSNNL